MRQDDVLPQLLGIACLRGEDSIWRAFANVDEAAATLWMDVHLDIDSTVEPLYGHQEEANLGYNPKNPGRPSHVYQTFLFSSARLVAERGCASGQPDGERVCAAGVEGLARWAATRGVAGVVARGYRFAACQGQECS